jgi:uncharacterized protein YndB with AHSA1/START domain
MREDIEIRRFIEAPVDAVWRSWTDPELVRRWWGPKYYSSPSCVIDLRVGGRYLFCMRAPAEMGGGDSYTAGVYRRIEPDRLLEFSQYLADASGAAVDPAAAGMPPEFPKEMTMTVAFKPVGALTRMTLTVVGWTASQMFVFAYAGMHQSMDKLEKSVETART